MLLARSIYCWHGHAARRSALPHERFSPLALFGHGAMSDLGPLCASKRTLARARRSIQGGEIEPRPPDGDGIAG
jgi:hypothetical protein